MSVFKLSASNFAVFCLSGHYSYLLYQFSTAFTRTLVFTAWSSDGIIPTAPNFAWSPGRYSMPARLSYWAKERTARNTCYLWSWFLMIFPLKACHYAFPLTFLSKHGFGQADRYCFQLGEFLRQRAWSLEGGRGKHRFFMMNKNSSHDD